ncbi:MULTISPECIES: signal peptidase II [unclassified Curtobacterium]|uniref:signal peptidase II n=1 Tax=unclassified Curtobacterium TaxID=257496 RepID=UPI0021ACD7FD|nr:MULTISPECIES: signal peptidase II [unclassified Curtobacterium]WIE55815.1 signal peptidase II [Curtobacterium sp. MCBD17_003]
MPQPHPAAPAERPAKVSVRAIAALAFAAVCVYALDQVVKALVVAHLTYGATVPVLGGLLQLHYVTNPGAAFSFATGQTWIFSIVAAAVVVAIVITARRIRSLWWAVLFGMLLGGALGNLTDRLTRPPGFGRGQVVDFIYTPWMMPAIYNIADSFICISMAIFVVLTLLGVNLDGTRTPSKRTQAARAGADDRAGTDDREAQGRVPGAAPATDGGATAVTSEATSAVGAAPDATAGGPADGDRASRPSLGHDAT